jgi:hypothetical protein
VRQPPRRCLFLASRCGYELPPTLPFFAMPEGARRNNPPDGRSGKNAKKKRPPADRFFTFVLTDGAGAHYYGGCLERHFRSADGATTALLPRSSCVLSRVPAFSAFRDVLARLHVLTGGEAPLSAAAVRSALGRCLHPAPNREFVG